jgi:hypothetical protein
VPGVGRAYYARMHRTASGPGGSSAKVQLGCWKVHVADNSPAVPPGIPSPRPLGGRRPLSP